MSFWNSQRWWLSFYISTAPDEQGEHVGESGVYLCSHLSWCELAQCVQAAGPPAPPGLVFGWDSLLHMDAPINVYTHTAVCTSTGAKVYLGARTHVIVTMALGLTQDFEAVFLTAYASVCRIAY